jgi:hypothetical protein
LRSVWTIYANTAFCGINKINLDPCRKCEPTVFWAKISVYYFNIFVDCLFIGRMSEIKNQRSATLQREKDGSFGFSLRRAAGKSDMAYIADYLSIVL